MGPGAWGRRTGAAQDLPSSQEGELQEFGGSCGEGTRGEVKSKVPVWVWEAKHQIPCLYSIQQERVGEIRDLWGRCTI